MSDDLHDGTRPEGGWPPVHETPAAEAGGDTRPRVGFCQDCGKPLTSQTVRSVGTSVFCEPCLAARVAAAVPVPPAAVPGEPHPVLAALLGLIPGVGAMYNGQFAKGIAHLIVFAILVSLSDHVNGIFGLFVAGWVFYQVFDAYHTAKARLEGLPLPNPFGFNDIGERMGFGRNWPNSGATWGSAAKPPSAGWQATTPPPPVYGAGAVPPPPPGGPVGSGPDWVGYVPPTHFASYGQPPYNAPYSTPYASATPPAAVPVWTAQPLAPVPLASGSRLPVGAIWLIALGGLILAANLVPNWRMSDRWFTPVLLAGLAIWLFLRRLRRGARLVCILRWPVVLMLFAIHFALRAADVRVNFGLFLAVLLIVLGTLLLMERALDANRSYAGGYPPVAADAPDSGRASFVPTTEAVAPAPNPQTETHEGENR
jgi:TM2 domain-containing membrane protein YozV